MYINETEADADSEAVVNAIASEALTWNDK